LDICIVHVQVFFRTLNKKTVSETKTYDYSITDGGSFWSALGGVFSLFLGISLAAVFEVVEIFIDFIANALSYIAGRSLGRDYHYI
jgi:hypothetical protein